MEHERKTEATWRSIGSAGKNEPDYIPWSLVVPSMHTISDT